MVIDFLRAHQRFTRKLPQSLEFNEYQAKVIDHGAHLRIWVAPHKSVKQWVYKASYSLNGLGCLGYSSGHTHASLEDAKQDAIAVGEEIAAYVADFATRLYCPSHLAPVFSQSGHFIENEETDRRVIEWCLSNLTHLGNDENTRIFNPLVERTRHYTIRVNALWLSIELGFNSISLKRDAAPSYALYYAYGMAYGLKGDQFASLADDIPF